MNESPLLHNLLSTQYFSAERMGIKPRQHKIYRIVNGATQGDNCLDEMKFITKQTFDREIDKRMGDSQ